jgi:hypothetical protein
MAYDIKMIRKGTDMTIIYDLSKIAADTREQIESTPKYRKMFSEKPKKLLAIDGNAKTIKGQKKGFQTAILYLTPASGAGENMCAMAVLAQCDKPCLNTAGRGAMSNVQLARLRKTLFYIQYREEFLAVLKKDIARCIKKIIADGFVPLVRLNGTSDIRWENYGIPQMFPDVQFYDYTKLVNRSVPANYDLTFSYSGVPLFQPFVKKAVDAGMRVAVVFRNRSIVEQMLVERIKFMDLEVVDGDDTDIRHIDPAGSVVALYAKGKAKKDTSGFVVG